MLNKLIASSRWIVIIMLTFYILYIGFLPAEKITAAQIMGPVLMTLALVISIDGNVRRIKQNLDLD